MKRKIQSYNVLVNDVNRNIIEPYDVMPYFANILRKMKPAKRPQNRAEVLEFIKKEGMYMFWSRCEWEIIISDWPTSGKCEEKWDVYDQIKMNIDIVANILIDFLEL